MVRPKLDLRPREENLRALLINLIQKDLTFLLIPQNVYLSLESRPRLQEYTFFLCIFTLLLSFLASSDRLQDLLSVLHMTTYWFTTFIYRIL